VFKSPEEREAARRERDAKNAREAAAMAAEMRRKQDGRDREAFYASPVGLATSAKEAGDAFFQVQLEVSRHTGTAHVGVVTGQRTESSSAAILGEIEKIGWHLEHVGYYFMVTRETSSNRAFGGEATAVNGVTIGVYLFRNTEPR
jgi:hypothetical protein